MAHLNPTAFNLQAKLEEIQNLFYDPQLEALELGLVQIQKQSLPELEDSLTRINDALRDPSSFGILRLEVVTEGSEITLVVVKSKTPQFEFGVTPRLLVRKKLILDQLRHLRAEKGINSLQDLIKSLSEVDLRDRLQMEYEARFAEKSRSQHNLPIRKGVAFVVMAMTAENAELEDVLDAIKEAAVTCNVVATRIDDLQSNERITDRVLDSIIQAEFVIVDLTYARPNVYYEAGYAQAMKKHQFTWRNKERLSTST
jgi:hypothetical protein